MDLRAVVMGNEGDRARMPYTPDRDRITERNCVQVAGQGESTLVLAHGFGCDQNMWRFVLPELRARYRVVTFDYVGWGGSRLSAYDPQRYAGLDGHARDVLDILEALDLSDVTFVGHSVSTMIGLLASLEAPQRFRRHIMVCPSPCFMNCPPEYFGGFERQSLEELLDLMDKNLVGWAYYLAPLVLGESADPELVGELEESFCSTDPLIAKNFAQATFFCDLRDRLPAARHPSLLLQSRHDSLAPVDVGEYMHRHMPGSELRLVEGHGHCLHMTHPQTVVAEIHRAIGPGPGP